MLNAYLYEGLRTPFGRHAGTLAKVRPDDLLADVMRNLMKKSAFKPEQIEDIIVGCANQSGEDSRCVARHAGLLAGLPIDVPGTVLQRNCASGLGALVHAAHAITAGEGDVFLVGGVENMSRSPLVMSRSESAFGRDVKLYDSTIGPRFSNPKLVKQFGDDQMPQTADRLAREYGIKREEADTFALASQQKYAIAKGEVSSPARFPRSSCRPPARGRCRRSPTTSIRVPRSIWAALAKMKSLYRRRRHDAATRRRQRRRRGADRGVEGGGRQGRRKTHRARDRERRCRRAAADHGHRPRRRIEKSAGARRTHDQGHGCDRDQRSVRGAGIVVPQRTGRGVRRQPRQSQRRGDRRRPSARASGARLALTAARQLQRSGGRYALVSLCIGGGQGMTAILERV